MDSNCSEYKGSFELHKINKNDNYAGSLEMRNINTSNPEIMGSGSLGELVNANMSIEDYWTGIPYTQGERCSTDPNCNGKHGTCVLASFAIAAYPFVKKNVIEYFDAYCKHYNLDVFLKCKQCVYDKHFQKYIKDIIACEQGLGAGYSLIWKLYHKSQNEIFQACRDAFSLDKIENQNTIEGKINYLGDKLKNGSTAILFINIANREFSKKYGLRDSHSIALAYSTENKFFYRDPNYKIAQDKRTNIETISTFTEYDGVIGDCLILTKKTS